jgi:uncharacterized membrane protein YfcA
MDPVLTLAGFGVGVVVGLTGMGGGALMTPILVLVFGVPPVAAVSSDLAATAVMKPFGGLVHARRGTVRWPLVGWLCLGSVPSAFAGVLLLRLVGPGHTVQRLIQVALAIALLLAALGLVIKEYGTRRRPTSGEASAPLRIRPLPTTLLGAAGGLVVGLTSVGSGSLIIVVLLALYPSLRANDLVGTDLVQAVPLVAAAALGHVFFGDLRLDIAAAVLAGSIPGVLLGARLSARAPAGVIRSALVVVLLASSLKLFGLPNLLVVSVAAGVAAVACAGAWPRLRRPSRTPAPAAARTRRSVATPADQTAPTQAAHAAEPA